MLTGRIVPVRERNLTDETLDGEKRASCHRPAESNNYDATKKGRETSAKAKERETRRESERERERERERDEL